MEQAFSVVAHPQALVAAGGLLALSLALGLELSLLVRLLFKPASTRVESWSASNPESFDWMYE